MKIGDTVKIKALPWKGWEGTVIDDCYRFTDGLCATVLVRLNNKPDREVEVKQEELESNYGKDI